MSSVLVAVPLAVIIMLTVLGNVVVCLAVGASRKLRCVTNCFIVSLAVTDLLLGLLVLPLSAVLQLTGEWPLGATFCNIYISLDVMLCTASILNLFAISVDRYFAVTAPLRYPALVTSGRVAMAMVLIWVVSLMVSFLPIHLGWNTPDFSVQNHGQNDRACLFRWNRSYVLVDAFATFYLPLLVMCGTYYRIFRIAREQARRINSRPSSLCSAAAAREHKATVTLAAVLGAFIICWFPYFTFFTCMGLWEEPEPPQTAYAVVLWLGYANSTLNPILYAALNRDFRTAYGQLLCCKRLCWAPPSDLTAPPTGQLVLLCAHTSGCRETSPEETGLVLQERNGSTFTNTQDR
ncbi:histamine H2 receptor-like [Megalops cyprinoides]|uniref:histamine H2 receptor-like n=1 Tax=Megalops cyprinoides TaxID=118141 RepID=UPI0018656956|nr:histamine H2 receptor-like [Megalops cyprinoides]